MTVGVKSGGGCISSIGVELLLEVILRLLKVLLAWGDVGGSGALGGRLRASRSGLLSKR